MIIFPAIDLMDGHVVRLEQGRKEAKTVYGSDPAAFAKAFRDQGAKALHIVDLDGAFTGAPKNLGAVRKIVESAGGMEIELGGGLRDEETIAAALGTGVNRVILGTRACESLPFVEKVVARFGSVRIAAGIDAKEGKVAIKGWTEASALTAVPLAKQLEAAGVGLLIYTDISTDGMFTGPNYPALGEVLAAVRIPVIASGGIGAADHIAKLRALPEPRPYGAIVGKALYDKKVALSDIL